MSIGDFFRRVLIPVRQRPSSEDLNALQYVAGEQLLAQAGMTFGGSQTTVGLSPDSRFSNFGASGFYAAGLYCQVNPSAPPFGVRLLPGVGYSYSGPADATDIDGCQGADWNYTSQWAVPIVLSSSQNFTVPAPPPVGSSRIDIIEIAPSYLATDPQTVGIFDPGSSVFNPTVANKSVSWDLLGRTGAVNAPAVSTAAISYVTGQTVVGDITAATEPTGTSGYMKVARINLDASGGAVAAVTQSMIADLRRPLLPNNMLTVAGSVSIPGVLAGLGTEALNSVQLPQGVVLKAVLMNGAGAGGVGISYSMIFYIIGGDVRSSTSLFGNHGCAVVSPSHTTGRRIGVPYGLAVSKLTPVDVLVLSGGDANYTVVNGTHTFAVGQPYAAFILRVEQPAGTALDNTEDCYFQYTISLGAVIL